MSALLERDRASAVGAAGSAANDSEPVTITLRALVVTASPQVFAGALEPLAVITNSASGALNVLDACAASSPPQVFLDVGPLGEHMTGQRLLKVLRDQGLAATARVWLMASGVTPQLRAWAQRAGAVDMIERSPESVLAIVDPGSAWRNADGGSASLEIGRVEAAFRAQAGPFGQVHLREAHAALQAGACQPTGQALARFLALRFQFADRQQAFLAEVGLAELPAAG